jgi:RND family efflux transporter MFP subunit
MKRYIYIVTMLVPAIYILSSCTHDEQTRNEPKDTSVAVSVSTARKEAGHTVKSSGEIASVETAAISTRIMGFITSIKVKPGDRVQKGQLLVTISSEDLLARRAQAQAAVSEAEAALRDAQKDYERYTELYKQQSASQKELENTTLHYEALKAKTEAARQMWNEVNAMLNYTNLKAPFAGVVTQKNLDAGSMASPGTPILVLEQTGSFCVNTSVTDADINLVNAGAQAQVVVESIRRTLTGKVSEVSPSSQMNGGRYNVKIEIPAGEKNGLRSGMYTKVSIDVSGKVDDHIVVPVAAIVTRDQLNGIYTISENKTALLRWVKLGRESGDHVEVLSGLSSDEQFIVSAEGKLYNGVPVIIK